MTTSQKLKQDNDRTRRENRALHNARVLGEYAAEQASYVMNRTDAAEHGESVRVQYLEKTLGYVPA